MIHEKQPSNRLVNIALLLMFCFANLMGVLHHEIWLDEAHHWLLARDSNSVSELLFNTRYEGHPLLWNLILFGITRFSSDVLWMQIVHLTISTLAVGVVLFNAPLRTLEKMLFIGGYFVLYEYAAISRNYSLLMLFSFLSIIFLNKRKYFEMGACLAILANAHLFGLIISSCFVLMVIIETKWARQEKISAGHVTAFFIFLLGTLISLWQIIPPLDSTLYTGGLKSSAVDRLARASVVFFKGFMPLPDFTYYHFWNTNIFITFSKPLCILLSLIFSFIPLLCFRKRFHLMLFFYSASMLLILFFYLSDLQAVRYFGILYIIYFTSVWLSPQLCPLPIKLIENWSSKLWKDRYNRFLFSSILSIQLVAGIISYLLEWRRPFSESKATSQYIISNLKEAEIISGGCGAAPISSYLGRKLYYISDKNYGSFCRFNRPNNQVYPTEQLIKQAALNFTSSSKKSVVLITHEQLSLNAKENNQFKLIESFTRSVVRRENYYLYWVFAR